MVRRSIAFHAAHEQHPPSRLLALLRSAELAGFAAGSCSDHFHPWSERQGHAGFSWSWLGAALQSTALPLSVVCAPGPRYHPAIIAQAVSTLSEMFPNRFTVMLGSGEALNENIIGQRWPDKATRNAYLKESVEIMRALWRGETVSRDGHVKICDATLYTRCESPPKVFIAALSATTAEWAGSWADGLITAGASTDGLREIIDAFQQGGGGGKPVHLQSGISYARTDGEAVEKAHHQWRHAGLETAVLANLTSPREFDSATAHITFEEIRSKLRISSSLNQHVDWLEESFDLGFSQISILNVSGEMDNFIHDFADRVLPAFGAEQTFGVTPVEHPVFS